MRRLSWAGGAVAVVAWFAAASLMAVWGWRVGSSRGPLPGGCSCFNPLGLPFVIAWGLVGALVAVLLLIAVTSAIGYAMHVRARRHRRAIPADVDSAQHVEVDSWLSDVAQERERRQ